MLFQHFTKSFAVIFIGLSYLAPLSYAQLDTYQTIQAVDKINFTFSDENDNKHQLSEYYGKIIIVNIWATWCPPCVAEMPSLNEVAESFPDDVVILTLLKDSKTLGAAQKLFKSKDFKRFILCYSHDGEIANHLKVKGLPTTFIINRQGYMIGKQVGGIHWDHIDMLNLIQSYVAGKSATPSSFFKEKFLTLLKFFNFNH